MFNFENEKLEPPGSENLSPKDRQLNLLSRKFELATNALNADSYRLIKVADSEIPEEPAELKTDVLARVKETLKILNNLITPSEERNETLFSFRPSDGVTKDLISRRAPAAEWESRALLWV